MIYGEHKGRNLWARLNLINTNNTDKKIAQQELAAICRAIGVLTPKDSAQLHDLPLRIKVKLTKRADNGEPTNEISGYKSKMSGADAANGVMAGAIAPNTNGNGGATTAAQKPGWMK